VKWAGLGYQAMGGIERRAKARASGCIASSRRMRLLCASATPGAPAHRAWTGPGKETEHAFWRKASTASRIEVALALRAPVSLSLPGRAPAFESFVLKTHKVVYCPTEDVATAFQRLARHYERRNVKVRTHPRPRTSPR
jgi:hypothetical protein